MSKSTLKPLSPKTIAAQKELDMLLKLIEVKQPILDKLILHIHEAESKLKDSFSHKELELKRVYRKKEEALTAENLTLQASVIASKKMEQEVLTSIQTLEKKQIDAQLLIDTRKNTLTRLNLEVENLHVTLAELRSTETTLNNRIDKSVIKGKEVEDELSKRIAQSNVVTSTMKKEFDETYKNLGIRINASRVELARVKKEIISLNNQASAIESSQKLGARDLTLRENALIIKIKAFNKEKQAFDTDIRRWSYTKPSM
jgi:hypothetical protein